MPDKFHQLQIWSTFALTALFGILYAFAPASKSEALVGIIMALVGFLTGKFSNGYAKKSKAESESEE